MLWFRNFIRTYFVLVVLTFFSACSDYVGQIDGQIDEYNAHESVKYESMIPLAEEYVNPFSVFEGTLVDTRDSQSYRTVTIGTLTWMAENLNYEAPESYCYNDEKSYCDTYGRLYTWASAMDSAGNWGESGKGCGNDKFCTPTYPVRGVCPEGWHLPSFGEWETLLAAVDETKLMVAAQKLRAKNGWHDCDNCNDEYGFSALPAGAKTINGKYFYEGSRVFFWTSTDDAKDYVDALNMNSNVTAEWNTFQKNYGVSVRCVKDVKDTDGSSAPATSEPATFVEPCNTNGKDDCKYGTMTDERDGRAYKTVKIGTQTWMAENLHYSPNDKYGYADDYVERYGQQYSWAAAMDSLGEFSKRGKGCGYYAECTPTYHVRGVCPAGWHLPTSDEFERLFIAAGGAASAGKVLKSTSGWKARNGFGTDAYGFSVDFAEACYPNDEEREEYTIFWTSTNDSGREAHDVVFNYSDAVSHGSDEKAMFHTVRCVMD